MPPLKLARKETARQFKNFIYFNCQLRVEMRAVRKSTMKLATAIGRHKYKLIKEATYDFSSNSFQGKK